MRLVRWLGVITLMTAGLALAAVVTYILYVARLWTQAMQEEEGTRSPYKAEIGKIG